MVASQESIEMAEKMISGEIPHIKLDTPEEEIEPLEPVVDDPEEEDDEEEEEEEEPDEAPVGA